MGLFQKQKKFGGDLVAVERKDLSDLLAYAISGASTSLGLSEIEELKLIIETFQKYVNEMLPEDREMILGRVRVSAQMDLASAGREDSYTDPEIAKVWLEFSDTNLKKHAI